MAYQTTSTPGSGYGNPYIDSLVWGCQWTETGAYGMATTSNPIDITYSFGSGPIPGGGNGSSFSVSEVVAFQQALALFSSVCNVNFVQTSYASVYASQSNLVFYLVPESYWGSGSGVLGMAEVPDGTYSSNYAYFNWQHSSWNNLAVGSSGFFTIIHELGHAMGLAHPHDGGSEVTASVFPGVTGPSSTGTYGLNQGIWTVMSYNADWSSQPATSYNYGWGILGAFDIAAMQTIYGANTNYNTGSNTYSLPNMNSDGVGWFCIWDAGGDDTISNATSGAACVINLNSAPLTGENAGGYVSYIAGIYGGYTIANNVIIENGIGGLGSDVIIGNSANNVLTGGLGNDTLDGGVGVDTASFEGALSSYRFGYAGDVLVVSGLNGVDSLINIEILNFALSGNVSVDSLQSAGLIEETSTMMSNGISSTTILDNYSGPVYWLRYYSLGSIYSDVAIGTSQNDFFNLLGGADACNGGAGDDVLDGGTGSNFLTGGAGRDDFFLDGRGGSTTWATITDWSSGERLSVWGWQPGISTALWVDSAGAAGFTGVTMHGDLDGNGVIDTSVTFAGLTYNQLPSPLQFDGLLWFT